MKKMSLFFALLTVGSIASANTEIDPAQFDIVEMKVRELPTKFASNVAIGSVDCGSGTFADTLPATPEDILSPLNTFDMVVDKIINIGKKIFAIVQAGKPVVNMKTDIATAMPQGARCWTDLQGWQMPQSKTYQVAFTNGFGMEVVKLSYRVLWLAGGNVEGAGQYIGYATMAPENIEVSWGFSLNANVSVPTVFNMGTKESPIAGMQMNMGYRIESPIKTIDQGQAFFVNGAGAFQQLQ